MARMVRTCLEWAGQKLIYDVDVFNQPYETEADWSAAYRIAEQLAEAGLGITVHVAEVAPVNVASVLRSLASHVWGTLPTPGIIPICWT